MCEDCTEEYWPEVMAVQLEQVQSVSGLLHGTWTKLVYLELLLQTKPRTEWKPIKRFQFNSGLPCHIEKIIYFESLEFTSL